MDARTLSAVLVENGVKWVGQMRRASRPLARRLTEEESSALCGQVDGASLLRTVRVRSVARLDDPPFYASLPDEQRGTLIDFAGMAAITFVDTIVARDDVVSDSGSWRSTLFHELVHVTQYAILGVEGFVHEYVDGFVANGRVHRRIPLEQMAYALQERFDRGEAFSVAKEVGRQLQWPP